MDDFKQYRRKQICEFRPWHPNDDMRRISISANDKRAGSPKTGDMITRHPKNHADQWLVAAKYFEDNFEPLVDTKDYSATSPEDMGFPE